MSIVLRFVRLPPADRLLLLQAALWLLAVRLALWLLPFHAVRRLAAGPARPRRPAIDASPQRLAWVIAVISRHIPGFSCLTQALAGQILLAQAGHDARLHIGVSKQGARLDAHAWLELEGEVLLGGSENLGFTPFPALLIGGR